MARFSPKLLRWRDFLLLSKHKLTGLVVYTASVGYVMRTVDEPASLTLKGFWPSLAAVSIGTALSAASANAFNQVIEFRRDAQMARTRLRPVARGAMPRSMAVAFGIASGLAGILLLDHACNPTCAALAGANIALYAAVYTPLKVVSPINTWVGAIVGAIPPLIGWTAAAGELQWRTDPGVHILPSLLFLWQIPHFHALALVARKDYNAGGYRMLAQINPKANANWAVLTSIAMLPLGPWAVSSGLVTSEFAVESFFLSLAMVISSLRLAIRPESMPEARSLFRSSITYLPLTLTLMMMHHVAKQTVSEPLTLSAGLGEVRTSTEVKRDYLSGMTAPFIFLPLPRPAPLIVTVPEPGTQSNPPGKPSSPSGAPD